MMSFLKFLLALLVLACLYICAAVLLPFAWAAKLPAPKFARDSSFAVKVRGWLTK